MSGDGGWGTGLDEYSLRARFLPGVLAIIAPVGSVVAFGLRENRVATAVVGVIGLALGTFLLATVARSLGKPHQARIFGAKGGAPTTHALRLSSTEWPDTQRANWRRDATRATERPLSKSPSDGEIAVVVEILREMTRDPNRFAAVATERISFGLHRNLLGVRHAAIALGTCAFVASIFGSVLAALTDGVPWTLTDQLVATLVSIGVLAFFAWFPNDSRVWTAGRSYAERLMAAAGTLAQDREMP